MIYPLESNRRREEVEMTIQSNEHANKRLPAVANRAVWENLTKGRGGIRWDNAVDKVWKGIGGNQDILSMDKSESHLPEIGVTFWSIKG